MSEMGRQRAHGHCMGCGRDKVGGELINEVYGNSGGGWTNVLCDSCLEAGRGPQLPQGQAHEPRTWT